MGMSENSLNLIALSVAKKLAKGRVVDVYELVAELEPHITDMKPEQIASAVELRVIEGFGNAYWSREKPAHADNGDRFVDHRDDEDAGGAATR